MEQLGFLVYHLPRWETDAMHVDRHATQAPNVHTSAKSQREKWGINLAGTSAKSKIMAEHQAQQHAQAAVPSSDITSITTIICNQCRRQHHKLLKNTNNEIGGCMSMQVGVVNVPTAGL